MLAVRHVRSGRQRYVGFLSGEGPFTEQDLTWKRQSAIVGGDPLPYGIAANRRALEHAARLAYEQHLTPELFQLEELFEPDVLRF